MSDAPLMPKATAVWLVENTSLTFDQIAEFCKLHPLEVKGIADGEVATGIKGFDPISAGQLSRRLIDVPAPVRGGRSTLAWSRHESIAAQQASQGDRGGAHRARLEGNVEIALDKMLSAEPGRAGTQHQHFGMRGRVAIGLDPVAGGGEHTAFAIDQDGADRHLATGRRRLGLGESKEHRRARRHPPCQRRIGSGMAIGRRVDKRMNNPSCSASA